MKMYHKIGRDKNIIPIYKDEHKEEPLDYRPMFLMSVACKLCEKNHQKKYGYICRRQAVKISESLG